MKGYGAHAHRQARSHLLKHTNIVVLKKERDRTLRPSGRAWAIFRLKRSCVIEWDRLVSMAFRRLRKERVSSSVQVRGSDQFWLRHLIAGRYEVPVVIAATLQGSSQT